APYTSRSRASRPRDGGAQFRQQHDAPQLYSDLLLHDMGAVLADGFEQGSANVREFRTAPLWRVSDRQHFLHDGRASTILDAIRMHGGQAADAVSAFQGMDQPAARVSELYLSVDFEDGV